jgi:flap endonuclease-1
MGVNLRDFVEFSEVSLNSLANKTVAVDAFNIIFQFLSTIRQRDGTPLMDSHGNVTSHLSGIFYRNMNLLEKDISLIYVFDGKPPKFKAVKEIRQKRKEKAEEKYEKALKEGDYENALKFAKQTSRLTSEIIEQSKNLLNAMGIPTVQAPAEGEAQAALINREGHAYAVSSQDYDSLLFGSKILVRNLNSSGRRKIPGRNIWIPVKPEMAKLQEVLAANKIDHEQLVTMSILIGTDYNPSGVKGIGPKTAIKLVKEHKTPEKVFANVDWEYEVEPMTIFKWFMFPEVDKNYKLDFPQFDEEKIKKILVDSHDFGEERIQNRIDKIYGSSNKIRDRSQKSLKGFF